MQKFYKKDQKMTAIKKIKKGSFFRPQKMTKKREK